MAEVENPIGSDDETVTVAGLLGVREAEGATHSVAKEPIEGVLTYAYMALARRLDTRFEALRLAGRLAKWYSAIGHEATTVPAGLALRPGDVLCTLHRDLGAILAYYLDPATTLRSLPSGTAPRADWPEGRMLLRRLACQLLGKGEGFSQGIERSFHYGYFAAEDHLAHVGMISHLGSMIPVATGCAFYLQRERPGAIAINFIGDGGTSTGDFHEALNFASVWKLPMILVIENNQYAFSTPVDQQYGAHQLSDRALGYGMPGETVDGNDPLAMSRAMQRAVTRARSGDGPSLIEAVVGRMRGHAEGDDSLKVVPAADLERYLEEDPVPSFRTALLRDGVDEALLEAVEAEVADLVEDALEYALASDPPRAEVARRAVLAPVAAVPPQAHGQRFRIERTALPPETLYVDAVRQALADAMRDERTILLGQDIGAFEGPFRTTRGLHQRWPERVLDTPISESGTVGLAVGAALLGHYPVIEMQFADFVSCGFNQIVNVAAKLMYRFERPCPLVVRLPSGGGVGAGAFHSQNPEGWFAHVAGLKVVCPATAWDAYHLLCDAIEDPNPVIFCEHKYLYRRARTPREDVGSGSESSERPLPLGRAEVRRAGSDLSVIAYGSTVPMALEAAERLAVQGIDLEVVDLRSLVPFDRDTVLASVRKTGRVLVTHEAQGTGGFGAEIAAVVADEAFAWLDAPVRRVTYPDYPVPFVKALERELMPSTDRLVKAVQEILRF